MVKLKRYVILEFQEDCLVLLSPQLPPDLVPQVLDNKHKQLLLAAPVLHLNRLEEDSVQLRLAELLEQPQPQEACSGPIQVKRIRLSVQLLVALAVPQRLPDSDLLQVPTLSAMPRLVSVNSSNKSMEPLSNFNR